MRREDTEVLETTAPANVCLGFLTVVHEARGYLGGYLVTNAWSRPLEFRLTTAVQPNRIQELLYGSTLRDYICAELIGKTLVEKTSSAAQVILTDNESILEMRRLIDTPIGWIAETPIDSNDRIRCSPHHPEDVERIREVVDPIVALTDLAEPFTRIREAIAEARKMGATNRG